MTEHELIERLADKEHASWARWMDYLFSKCTYTMHGDAVIPMQLALRWKVQANTPYEQLSEQEKQSDRNEVAHILPIIKEYVNGTTEQAMVFVKRVAEDWFVGAEKWHECYYCGAGEPEEDTDHMPDCPVLQAKAFLRGIHDPTI